MEVNGNMHRFTFYFDKTFAYNLNNGLIETKIKPVPSVQ